MGKLNLDQKLVDSSGSAAARIADQMQEFIDAHTIVSTERAVFRLFGIDDENQDKVPMPNVVVDQTHGEGKLGRGISYYLGSAMIETGMSPQEIAKDVTAGNLDLLELKEHPLEEVKEKIFELVKERMRIVDVAKDKRKEYIDRVGEGEQPWLYVIVAAGNIHEDIVQAKSAALESADIAAVIRTTGRSLLDFVPYHAPIGGFGGTYATQENFRLVCEALDEVAEREGGEYVRICDYCLGLYMPEIAAMGAMRHLNVMLNDALYGILFRDINMQRILVDQYFSRVINGYAGIIINTGEDSYSTAADAFEEAHTVLASQYMNEQFVLKAGLLEEQMGLGHYFEMGPDITNGFIYESAQAQMTRQIFPDAPLKYMPLTKFMTGNIIRGHIQDTLFSIVSIITEQGLQLLGMRTEAVHTPHLRGRYLGVENAEYTFNNVRDLGNEIKFKPDGMMEQRAHEIMDKTDDLLVQIEKDGIFKTVEEGKFGDVRRTRDGDKGPEDVAKKTEGYFNPLIIPMLGREDT